MQLDFLGDENPSETVEIDSSISLLVGNCLDVMDNIEAESVHMAITDPPYFLDGLSDKWSKGDQAKHPLSKVNTLPSVMRFDKNQGLELQRYMTNVSSKMYRVLMPGSFALFFSQPRLSGRMSVGVEDAGFEIRDMYAWRFTKKAQAKAFSMNHFIRKMDISDNDKQSLKLSLDNRKTAQIRPRV